MLVKELDKYDLQNEFKAYDRDYFSLEGYQALLDLFEETDCGRTTDLDVIAICCDFNEYEPLDIVREYSNIDSIASCEDEETGDIDVSELMEALNYYTWAVELDNGNILYQCF